MYGQMVYLSKKVKKSVPGSSMREMQVYEGFFQVNLVSEVKRVTGRFFFAQQINWEGREGVEG